jgi:hypothetical protein
MRERSAPRVVPPKPVTVALETPQRPKEYGVIANISELGGCILTGANFKVGDEIVLTLSFPRALQPIETPGRIVWTGEGPPGSVQYGLKFDTTFELHVRLKELIDHVGDEPSDG